MLLLARFLLLCRFALTLRSLLFVFFVRFCFLSLETGTELDLQLLDLVDDGMSGADFFFFQPLADPFGQFDILSSCIEVEHFGASQASGHFLPRSDRFVAFGALVGWADDLLQGLWRVAIGVFEVFWADKVAAVGMVTLVEVGRLEYFARLSATNLAFLTVDAAAMPAEHASLADSQLSFDLEKVLWRHLWSTSLNLRPLDSFLTVIATCSILARRGLRLLLLLNESLVHDQLLDLLLALKAVQVEHRAAFGALDRRQ